MNRYLYVTGALYGLFRLVWWFRTPNATYIDLALAIVFMSWAPIFFFEETRYPRVSLVIRYALGLFILAVAAWWDQTLFMWGLGFLVLVVAVLDTFWPSR